MSSLQGKIDSLFTIQHAWLALCWVLYCILHSAFATTSWKQQVAAVTGRYFKYYRLTYSIFATFSLLAVLMYQFSFPLTRLFANHPLFYLAGALLLFPGVVLMYISIRKYFFDLSGIDVFFQQRKASVHLERSGLHRYTRHPLYLGTLLFIWGLFFWWPFAHHLVACTLITIYVLAGIRWEEKKLVGTFGEQYVEYAGKVPMLIPWRGIRN